MASEPLSDYEQLRARNIERNKQVMLALGIDDTDLVLHAAHNANGGKKKAAPKRKLEDSDAPRPSPTRRSSRTRGEPVRLLELDVSGEAESREECSSRTQAPLRGSEVDHALAEAEHNERWAGRQGKATIVGTASYQHTLMRVRTMRENALANRIKAIERAAGQHAVVKMRLFARVLCLESLDDLAHDANEALQRLIAKLGDPGDDEVKEQESPKEE